MGMGDDIMATVQARALFEATGHKVRPANYWSPVWDDNPCFAKEGEPFIEFNNKPGNRPYILGQTEDKFIWNPNFKAVPGELYVDPDPRGKGFLIIEPNVKGTVSATNKAYPFERWQEAVDLLDYPIAQMGNGPWLDGVERIETATFMEAVAVLASSKGFAGTDGGLHHAAAALNVPAVVLWGGFAPREMLGYDSQYNISGAGINTCGSKKPCQHCADQMENIWPLDVVSAIVQMVDDYEWPVDDG